MPRVVLIIAVAACLLGVTGSVSAAAQSSSSAAEAAPNELIVRFSARTDGSRRVALRDSVDAEAVRALPVSGSQLLRLTGDVDVDDAVARLERSPDVLYAEPNLLRTSSATMNDPFFSQLWGLRNTGQSVAGTAGVAGSDISASSAWDLTTGSATIVAVVDSGIASHPDLDPQLVPGWDFVDGDAVPQDETGHGTHVAGTIAARGNDGVGVVGVAPSAKIMPLRALDADGRGTVDDIAEAYTYAAQNGARVVNASLSGDEPSTFERETIAAHPDVLFVVAAGNDGDDVGGDKTIPGAYPCAYDLANVVCVAATDSSDLLASFSNYGATSVDLAAPGVDILSDYYLPTAGGAADYEVADGTSMATPHVAGVAALALALRPDASVGALKQSLLAGVDARSGLTATTVSGGRLNARRTLDLLTGVVATATPPAAPPASVVPVVAPAPVVARDATAPLASILLRARQRIVTIRRVGLLPRLTCSEACAASATLRLSSADARRARVGSGSRSVTIGLGQRALTSGVSTTLTVRLTRTASRALGKLRRPLLATLTVSLADAAGNRRTLRKAITLVAKPT